MESENKAKNDSSYNMYFICSDICLLWFWMSWKWIWDGILPDLIVLAALLGGCATITFLDGWARLPMWMLWILRGILLAFVVSFVIIEGCIISQMHAKADENLDYIIVLGAQVRADGPSKVLKHSSEHSNRLSGEESGDNLYCVRWTGV